MMASTASHSLWPMRRLLVMFFSGGAWLHQIDVWRIYVTKCTPIKRQFQPHPNARTPECHAGPWRPRYADGLAASLHPGNGRRLEAQIRRLALAPTRCSGIVEAADFELLLAQLAAPAHAFDADAARVGGCAGQAVLVFQVDEHEAAAALLERLEFADVKAQDAPPHRGTDHMRGGRQRLAGAAVRHMRGHAHGVALAQADEGLAPALAREHVLHGGQKAVAARAGQQQLRRGRAGKVVRNAAAA